jgi:hypothetical protein
VVEHITAAQLCQQNVKDGKGNTSLKEGINMRRHGRCKGSHMEIECDEKEGEREMGEQWSET